MTTAAGTASATSTATTIVPRTATATGAATATATATADVVRTPLTTRLVDRLPDAFTDADTDGHLRSYLTVALGDADAIDELTDEIADGNLAAPHRARPEWLRWLAQFVSIRPTSDLTDAQLRDRIAAGGAFLTGTAESIAAAARTALTGTRSAVVSAALNGDEFTIGLRTLASETPDEAAVHAAIEAAGARPAGFDVAVTYYSASWDTLEAAYLTSDAWDAVGSQGWTALEETGLAKTNPHEPRKYGEGLYGEGRYGSW